jgi:uncharacterized phage-like protein YoqJ
MIFGVTGHRPDKLGGYGTAVMLATQARVKVWLRQQLRGKATGLITGMALGVDQWAAEVCVDEKIPFTAALPFAGQEGKWPADSQVYYRVLLYHAVQVIYVSGPNYAAWKFQKRNEYVVDNCQILLAVWDGTSGGTANCVKYAHKVRRHMERFEP